MLYDVLLNLITISNDALLSHMSDGCSAQYLAVVCISTCNSLNSMIPISVTVEHQSINGIDSVMIVSVYVHVCCCLFLMVSSLFLFCLTQVFNRACLQSCWLLGSP